MKTLKQTNEGFRYRNSLLILACETELFKQIGMTKIGFEGVEPTFFTGGRVWYMAKIPNSQYWYTICFESWFGHIRLSYMRLLNPKIAKG